MILIVVAFIVGLIVGIIATTMVNRIEDNR